MPNSFVDLGQLRTARVANARLVDAGRPSWASCSSPGPRRPPHLRPRREQGGEPRRGHPDPPDRDRRVPRSTGCMVGLTGVLEASYYGSPDSTFGNGFELQVITGVIVGGVSFAGGEGGVVRARSARSCSRSSAARWSRGASTRTGPTSSPAHPDHRGLGSTRSCTGSASATRRRWPCASTGAHGGAARPASPAPAPRPDRPPPNRARAADLMARPASTRSSPSRPRTSATSPATGAGSRRCSGSSWSRPGGGAAPRPSENLGAALRGGRAVPGGRAVWALNAIAGECATCASPAGGPRAGPAHPSGRGRTVLELVTAERGRRPGRRAGGGAEDRGLRARRLGVERDARGAELAGSGRLPDASCSTARTCSASCGRSRRRRDRDLAHAAADRRAAGGDSSRTPRRGHDPARARGRLPRARSLGRAPTRPLRAQPSTARVHTGGRRLSPASAHYVDWGCILDGWYSDTGTTLAVGDPGPEASPSRRGPRRRRRGRGAACDPASAAPSCGGDARGAVWARHHGVLPAWARARDRGARLPGAHAGRPGDVIRDDCVECRRRPAARAGHGHQPRGPRAYARECARVHCERTFVVTVDGRPAPRRRRTGGHRSWPAGGGGSAMTAGDGLRSAAPRTISADRLRGLVERILAAAGADDEAAALVAASLVASDIRGVESHGVIRVGEYLRAIRAGRIRPSARPRLVRDAGAVFALDGDGAFGQLGARELALVAAERARSHGVALGTLAGVAHVGRLGEWVELAAARGASRSRGAIAATRAATSSRSGAGPPGSGQTRSPTQSRTSGGPPVVADFSTSVVAEGKVRLYLGARPAATRRLDRRPSGRRRRPTRPSSTTAARSCRWAATRASRSRCSSRSSAASSPEQAASPSAIRPGTASCSSRSTPRPGRPDRPERVSDAPRRDQVVAAGRRRRGRRHPRRAERAAADRREREGIPVSPGAWTALAEQPRSRSA